MSSRTSILLDDSSRLAARQLAGRYRCSTSEAIRRAIVTQRDLAFGLTAGDRTRRRVVLKRLFDLFEGNDAAAEVRRIKAEDDGF